MRKIDHYYKIDWKNLRKVMGWSQYAAADFLGMSRSNIVHMERRGYIPSRAWKRIEAMVNQAVSIKEASKTDPIPVLPSGTEPDILGRIDIPI